MKYLIIFIVVLVTCFVSYAVFGVRTFTQDEGSGAQKEPIVNNPVNMENKEYPRKYDLDRQQGEGAQGMDQEEIEEGMQEDMQENAQEEKMPKIEVQDKKEIQKEETSQEVKTPEPVQNNKPEPKEKIIKPTVTGSGEYKTY